MRCDILEGDCKALLPRLEANSIDAVVTDPPYEIGFMAKFWDGTGVAFSVDVWREVFRVLKPGGHLLAFGGTRTYHRMACAIEDAGFEIRDSLHWHYGTGFPKSLNVSKELEKRGDTDAAKQWDGWGTALKPGHEPIVMARKPLEGTVAANVQKHGTGGLNIDGCRIDAAGGRPARDATANVITGEGRFGNMAGSKAVGETTQGRWPANVLLDEDAARELDAQSGESVSRKQDMKQQAREAQSKGAEKARVRTGVGHADSGGASRFFYVAKPSRRERGDGNSHPTVKPVELMRYLVRLVTPPGGLVLDPFAGSGTTGVACRHEGLGFLGIELSSEYAALARARMADTQAQASLLEVAP